ncbi:MAG TPA: hypothetical protein VMG12_36795, partial [Polyangiaceae bacterium]|nr:hypothetical protein [Polyangiaceae bacterium]
MSHWESQIRTNLDDMAYSSLLDRGIASTPGTLAAGLVNVRYGEGCLRGAAAEQAPESELAQLIALSQWLFPPEPVPESSSARAAALTRVGLVESAFWTTRHERLFAQVVGDKVLVLAVASARNLGSTFPLVREAVAAASESDAPDFERMRDVIASATLDAGKQTFANIYRAYGTHTEFTFDDAMAGVLSQFFNRSAPRLPALFHRESGERLPILNLQLTTATRLRNWSALTFDPEHLLFVIADRQVAHQG